MSGRLLGDEQQSRDLGVRLPGGHEAQHVQLTRSQLRGGVAGCGAWTWGTPATPERRSSARSRSAAGSAPSRVKISSAVRWAASSPSASASARSYGQPMRSQAAAAPCQSPSICSA
jgi:hypothetical protein